jgi:hypothetical protein
MKKEKKTKSAPKDLNYVKGEWDIYIFRSGKLRIGHIEFRYHQNHSPQNWGTMYFRDDPDFHNIRGHSYDVTVSISSDMPGVVSFQIPEAATAYDPNTSDPYKFVFEGFYDGDKLVENKEFSVRVPAGFGGEGAGEDGDTISWMAEARGDTSRKHSE